MRELKINSPQFARIFLSRSMERWESRVEDHEIETFTGDENKFPSPGGERHRPVRLKHARHVEKCGVKVGKSRYRVIWCIYTRTHVALPQRQGFLRDIKFLINRISGSKVEGRKKREGRASATAKPLERDFRRCTRHANGWRERREEGSARDIRFARLTAIKRPTNHPVKHASHFSPVFLLFILGYKLSQFIWKAGISRLRGLLLVFVQNCAVIEWRVGMRRRRSKKFVLSTCWWFYSEIGYKLSRFNSKFNSDLSSDRNSKLFFR